METHDEKRTLNITVNFLFQKHVFKHLHCDVWIVGILWGSTDKTKCCHGSNTSHSTNKSCWLSKKQNLKTRTGGGGNNCTNHLQHHICRSKINLRQTWNLVDHSKLLIAVLPSNTRTTWNGILSYWPRARRSPLVESRNETTKTHTHNLRFARTWKYNQEFGWGRPTTHKDPVEQVKSLLSFEGPPFWRTYTVALPACDTFNSILSPNTGLMAITTGPTFSPEMLEVTGVITATHLFKGPIGIDPSGQSGRSDENTGFLKTDACDEVNAMLKYQMPCDGYWSIKKIWPATAGKLRQQRFREE